MPSLKKNRSRSCFVFFNDTATTEIYTLSLHDALPIWFRPLYLLVGMAHAAGERYVGDKLTDRKSTRLNSSHSQISYAVFCLKKTNIIFRSLLKNLKHTHATRTRPILVR